MWPGSAPGGLQTMLRPSPHRNPLHLWPQASSLLWAPSLCEPIYRPNYLRSSRLLFSHLLRAGDRMKSLCTGRWHIGFATLLHFGELVF
ncbi:unnamed protein product [Chrysoparadoxa australica]